MATVFLAQDLKHKRPVALKVLLPELAASLGAERFHREIEIAARLQHPHILTVLDSGEAAGQLWFTMPYVDGQSLRERLHREHQLPVEDALRITREAASALDYAHEQDVVHRDVKPENILLTRRGDVLVADFGIARALGAAGTDALTQTGMAVGTPAYMSPEACAGEADLDGRSDEYALACVLYEMLTGQPPFVAATTVALAARQMKGPAVLMSAQPSAARADAGATGRTTSGEASARSVSVRRRVECISRPCANETKRLVQRLAIGAPRARRLCRRQLGQGCRSKAQRPRGRPRDRPFPGTGAPQCWLG